MSEPERIYDPTRRCPKCGYEDIETEIINAQVLAPWRFPRLARACGRCCYYWTELPLDHDEELEYEAAQAWRKAHPS